MARARSHGWWDNYTFSKALAEMILVRECPEKVAVSIVRPSGITAALEQPCPGWLDAYLLVEPIIHGMGTGKITAFPGNPGAVIDVVPVDMVTSIMLAAAAPRPSPCGPCRVFHAGSGSQQPIKLEEIEKIWREYFAAHPMRDSSGKVVRVDPIEFYPTVEQFTANLRRKYIAPLGWAMWLIECTPFWSYTLGGPWSTLNKLSNTVSKSLRLASLYCSYTLNEWIFDTAQSESLIAALEPEDRASFNFDVKAIDWKRFWWEVHIPFMRRYLLKEAATKATAKARL